MAELRPGDDARPWWAGVRVDRRSVMVLTVAVIATGGAAAWWRRSESAALPPPAPVTARHDSSTESTRASVVVYVAGAVVHPAVVTLPAGARVVDAIDAAGGPRADADLEQLDLAARAIDGGRIYVPKRGEHVIAAAPGGDGDPSAPGSGAPGAPVDLNTATEAQLETLPGIGPSLAHAIITERERRGGFRRVQDLGSVRGIGPKRLAELTPLVSV